MTVMKIIRSVKLMQETARKYKLRRKRIGFVPTMGALHEGHLSLIRRARKENGIVIISIFVNPAQFGPREGFKKYPRDLKRDSRLCKDEGVDILFYPDAGDMYPYNYRTYVTVDGLSDTLCGNFRPGHFRGVATVVAKLFNIINPDAAYFGQKDAQQAIIIKRMVSDLNIPLKIKILPTVREPGGLAMSSRNVFLNPEEKNDAAVLYASLKRAKKLIAQGQRNPRAVIKEMKKTIEERENAKVEYISIVDTERLEPADKIGGKVLIALAVYIGKTRLIDNTIINV